MKSLPATLFVLAGLSAAAQSALTPIFAYRFPASYTGGVDNEPVIDQSAAHRNAQAYPRNAELRLALSDDVPPGAAAGTKSLDLAAINGSIRTDDKQLLERNGVDTAGGFTMDVWFKGLPAITTATTTQKILDDTGTEFIGVRGADGDGDGKSREVAIRLSSVANTFYLDEDDGLLIDGWNHIIYSFAVTSGGNPAALIGDVTVVLNGVVRTFPGKTLGSNASYTGFNRPASIGRHPTNVSEHYLGLVHNPSMYLGTKDPLISVTRRATDLEIIFEGVLQSSSDLMQWDDVPGAVSPHPFPLAGNFKMFFRARR